MKLSKVAKTLIVELLVLTTVAFAANKGPMNLQDPVDVNGQQMYGVERLRVADAFILPRVTTGNTMAPCVVIGERAAATTCHAN